MRKRVMSGATLVTKKVIPKNNVVHPAGYAMNQVTGTLTARREKIEEEARVGEEEEMSQTLVREGNPRKGGTLHMQRRKVIRSQAKVTELGTIVQVSLVQIRIDPVSQDPDLIQAQREKKILHQEERSQKEDQTKTDITRVIE